MSLPAVHATPNWLLSTPPANDNSIGKVELNPETQLQLEEITRRHHARATPLDALHTALSANDNGRQTSTTATKAFMDGPLGGFFSGELVRLDTKLTQILVAAGYKELATRYRGTQDASLRVPPKIQHMKKEERNLLLRELMHEREQLVATLTQIMHSMHQTEMLILSNLRG